MEVTFRCKKKLQKSGFAGFRKSGFIFRKGTPENNPLGGSLGENNLIGLFVSLTFGEHNLIGLPHVYSRNNPIGLQGKQTTQ
jgi:hypothetical protein